MDCIIKRIGSGYVVVICFGEAEFYLDGWYNKEAAETLKEEIDIYILRFKNQVVQEFIDEFSIKIKGGH